MEACVGRADAGPYHESIVEGSKNMSYSKHMFAFSGIGKPRLLFLALDRHVFVVSLKKMRRKIRAKSVNCRVKLRFANSY